MKARIVVESGDARPESLDLEPVHSVSLGRSRDNTIVLRNEHASRLHAKIVFEEGRWYIQDFSLNGTYVNGERVQQRLALDHGEEIRIGDIRLRFLVTDGVPPSQAVRLSGVERKDWSSSSTNTKKLAAADLSVLCAFMAMESGVTDARTLIRDALALLLAHSGAKTTGYLSPDPAEPLPKVVQPDGAGFDHLFSRHVTRKAQRDGKTIWLATEITDSRPTDSLKEITDAICTPVRVNGVAIGMIHAVRKDGYFRETDVRFAEALAEFLAGCLHNIQEKRRLQAEVAHLRSHPPLIDELIGDSPAMIRLRQQISELGPRPWPVLVRGEIGVGLEVVAQSLHRQSTRAAGPFVVAPCSAMAPTLLEGELFHGRTIGTTQPTQTSTSYCSRADEGTLFLDEISALSLDAQSKLIRLMDEKCIRHSGNFETRVDVRIIAATQADLESLAATGRFKRSLLERLSQAVIDVPPLRSHLEDIPYLVQYLLDKIAFECHRQVRLSEAALAKLQAYMWPGNHRQLRAELEAAALRTSKDVIDDKDILIGCDKHLLVNR
jgi:transcriptional regulator with GAF, ATPase, and Fis domain